MVTKDGLEFVTEHPGEWEEGQQVTLVIRAQKFNVTSPGREEELESTEMNVFKGTIDDRSYMGGETSYFIALEQGVRLHVISMVKRRAHRIGDTVILHVPARHCALLRREETRA